MKIYIVGPTCAGKTALSLELAGSFGGEIISADSVQFYDGLEIGTAKPTPAELKSVPHHLISCCKLGDVLTAGDYRRRVLQILEGRREVERFWIVGGSGFYISALQNGMFEIDKIRPEIREGLRKRLEQKGLSALYDELKVRDPMYAAKISGNDTYRVLRGLEIWEQYQKPLSQIRSEFEQQKPAQPDQDVKLGVYHDRDTLRLRVRLRTEQMLKDGLIEETENLLKQGLAEWPPLSAVGYKEVQAYLRGEIPRAELSEQISLSTLKLAKRQMTWFKRDPSIKWYKPEQVEEVKSLLRPS